MVCFNSERRKFIKIFSTGLITLSILPSVSQSIENVGNLDDQLIDDEFVIINGWVLLKSDISPE